MATATATATLVVAGCGGGAENGAEAAASAPRSAAMANADAARSAADPLRRRPAATDAATPATLAVSWTACARDGGYCSFSGVRDVRYGTAAASVTVRLESGTACSNAVFGDPAVGQAKTCAWADDGAADATAWVFCAYEWQMCSFTGTRQVRYGTLAQNVTASLDGGTACSNAVFGDPVVGSFKSCWYEDRLGESAAAGPMTGCAGENQFCAFSGTRSVHYGSRTHYATGTFTDGVVCSNEVFGDPLAGTYKTCSYSAAEVATARAPAPAPAPGATGTSPPIVFNASRSARAGDIVGLQGADFGPAPRVYLESAPGTPLEIVNRVEANWVAVQLPATAQGALILRVANATGTSAQVKLDVAVPYHLDALQVTSGGAFRIFGRNLKVAGHTPRVTVDGVVARVDLAASDEHRLSVVAPAALRANPAAVVGVDNGNGSGAATLDRRVEAVVVADAVDPFRLGVGWGAGFAAVAAKTLLAASDPRLAARGICGGARDDTPALQAAIDLAAADGGGVVRLPAGRCRLGSGLSLKSRVVLEGAGKAATELVYEGNYPIAGVGVDLAGIRHLTLTNAGSATEGPLLKDSTRVVVQGVRVQLGTSRQMYFSGNRQMVVADSDFEQAGSISNQGPYTLHDSSGLVFERNTTRWVDGAPAFGRVHDSVLAANRFSRDATPQRQGGAVHSMTLDFAHRVAVIGNTFDVIGGPITNKTRNDGETILTEGGATQRTENLGSVTAATATTLTDSGNTLQTDPFATGSVPENYGIAIVGGKGAGQARRVVGYARPTVTVDRAWDVTPDTTSRYASFVWGLEKSLIKGNTLTQNPRGIWLYHTAIRDVDVIGNTISEGGGIYLRSFQNLSTKSFMPIWNVLIANNGVVNTTGNWMSYIEAVFVNADAKAFGIANLGIEMRTNRITANRPNVYSGSEEYAGMEGYAAMMRVENYDGYESSPVPRLVGSILAGNACNYCDVAVRVGTGAGGTTIVGTQLVGSPKAIEDWATTSTRERSAATVSR